ncbi:transcription factor SPT20 homolog isoform X2 [Paramormyrops kingsleyae]|uniref:transcription factor SPT20 homolog isoform X2 n=1 Tax=Paramormyrops kingsleyae TaxID=1676925 RepID=UPI000CD63D8E|nr:transcription factor SPT20 homolog isoform X2 [Paramormyrops kingsleyae]
MQHILEYALDRAEYIVESARQRPVKRRCSSSGRKSLNQKLYELYIEECEREPELKKLRRNVNLLEKLVSQESVSCLVVNLYPGNEGYSLMLRGKNGSDSETIRLPYEEGELLEYLNGEQLPPVLLDLLEKAQVNIFHCGCVIAEVRDYRQSGNTKMPLYQSRYILLRPTMQTLICDVHTLTTDHHKWTQDDKLQLESQLILATAEPLCLDPSISVTCTANRLLYNKQKMNTRSMKRCFKRHSRAALNRQQEMAHYPPPPQLRLYDYLQKRKERKPAPSIDLKISKAGNCVDMWRRNSCQLTPPSEVDVEKYAVVEKSVKLEDAQPSVWPAEDMKDDYLFECEVGGQVQKTKVTIFQSVGDPQVYGEIYTAKDPKLEDRGSNLHLIHPPFLMGSKIDADRFLNQYKEVYERDVKCQVKMSHNPESTGGGRSQASPGGEPEADGYSLLVQPAMLGKTLKHRPPPIKLPSVSASSSSGTPYSSQTSSGQLKCTTPPPSKAQPLTRKHSLELGQVGLVSPAALSPLGSSQRSGTPKPSTPTPTNTPCSTPHPADVQAATPSVTPTPPDAAMAPQPALLAPFAQQQMALSQALPVMTIPLSSMATSITTGTSSSQVMANPTGLNFINVVGSVCGPQTLMSGSNPMLSCSPGALTPGINLGGILPPAGLMPTMQPTAQGGSPFGLGNPPGLRPLNLLQIPATPLIFNPLQQQVSQFSPQQQSSQSATPSPQQQGEPVDQGAAGPDQSLGSQAQAAVINLGGFMSPQAAVLSQLGCGPDRPGPTLPSPGLQLSSALQQQYQPQLQLRFLQHQTQQQQQQTALVAGAQAAQPRQHSASHPRSKRKRSTPQPLPKS